MLLTEIQNVLRTHRALIVHFSGTPRGIGDGQNRPDFPQDLHEVIANAGSWEIACSTASSGQNRAGGHFLGEFGLILRCRDGASLLGVCNQDAGSFYNAAAGKRHIGECDPPTVASCHWSITQRIRHNEWILANYEPVGLFFDGSFPHHVWDTPTKFQREVLAAEVKAFIGLPLLYFDGDDLREVYPVPQVRNIDDFI